MEPEPGRRRGHRDGQAFHTNDAAVFSFIWGLGIAVGNRTSEEGGKEGEGEGGGEQQPATKTEGKARQGKARQGSAGVKSHLDGSAWRAVDSERPEAGFLEDFLHHQHSPLDVCARHLRPNEKKNERRRKRTIFCVHK